VRGPCGPNGDPSHCPQGPIWLMQPIPYFGEELAGEWFWEPKVDGWRMQILRYSDGHVELWGRRLERHPDWTNPLAAIAASVSQFVPPGTLLDAELYTNLGRQWIPSLFARVPKAEPQIYLFDVVCWQRQWVADLPYEERKRLLRQLTLPPGFFVLEPRPIGSLLEALQASMAEGHEGIVIKRRGSPYEVGREAPVATVNWRKIKP
jgi:ATP-dependent DNA ligase